MGRITGTRTCVVAILLFAQSIAAFAQSNAQLLRDRSPDKRPALLVVGSAHWANPGRDLINTAVEDVLSPGRQSEIKKLADELAAFKPTHVAIEWPRTEQARLDERYRDYRAGRYELSRSEGDQLGLRLAALLGHTYVYAVDWNGLPPGDKKDWDWFKFGQEQGQKERIDAITDPATAGRLTPPLGNQTISAWLQQLNAPEVLALNHRFYFDIASVGDAEQQPGATWVGHWYARNLRIFSNLASLTTRPDDRILVIYGVGHAYLLRQFARESGAFRLTDVNSVLQKP